MPLGDFRGRLPGRHIVDVEHRNAGSHARERVSHRRPETPATAGDYGDLPGQISRHDVMVKATGIASGPEMKFGARRGNGSPAR